MIEFRSMPNLVVLAVLGAAVLAGAGTLEAQTADVAGAWTLEVETDQGVTNPSWLLEQSGTELTGSYESAALGQNRIRGSVDGMAIVIRFSADLQGQPVPVQYRGTLGDDGVIRGTIDIADGMLTGTFTARRRDG